MCVTCAITERLASTTADLLMSKMNSGFLIRLTQNLRGIELFFHMCTTSWSPIFALIASSSRKSNRYLMEVGRESAPGVYRKTAWLGDMRG